MTDIQAAIDKKKDHLRRTQEYYDRFDHIFDPLLRDLENTDCLIRFDIDTDSLDPYLSGSSEDYKVIHRVFRRHGFRIDDPPEKGQQTHVFWAFHDSDSMCRLFIAFTSTSCVRRKVGTEMKEVDVYETVCE